MKSTHKFMAAILATLVLAALTACGGGGGGGGFTPISYTGSTVQATVDETNAADFADLAEGGVFMVDSAPIPFSATLDTDKGVDIPVPVIQSILKLNKTLPAYFGDDFGSSNVAAATQTFTDFCNGIDAADGTITTSESISGSSGTATITFNNCDQGGGLVMNGAVALSTSDVFADPTVAPMTINVTFRNLEMTFTDIGETVTIYAVMSMTVDERPGSDPEYIQNISNLILADSASGLTARISNYKITVTEVSDPVTGFYDHDEIVIASASVKARVYDYDLGYVEFYTVTPIKDDGLGPYEGILHIDGGSGSSVEINFGSACPNGTVYIDETPTGSTFCYTPAP